MADHHSAEFPDLLGTDMAETQGVPARPGWGECRMPLTTVPRVCRPDDAAARTAHDDEVGSRLLACRIRPEAGIGVGGDRRGGF